MKSSGIGGQAVLEGVMMRNKNHYAVAVRKPDGEIAVNKGNCSSVIERYKILGIPVVRGIVSFVESLVLGMKMLTSSAAYFDGEEEEPGKFELWLQKKFGEKADKIVMGCTVFCSIVLAVAIFMLLPLAIVSFIDEDVISYEWKTLLEGLLRVAIFLGYVVLISRMKDIRRVFMYHGAEHKTINCIEHGMEPTVENVRTCSRQHKRCGTSFLLFVMLISVLFFLLVRVETIWLRFVVRILFVPLIAGISYEFIRLAGSSDSKVVNVLSKPGLWLQGFTTREPDDDMIRVAVASVEAVFDWKDYLEKNFSKKNKSDKASAALAAAAEAPEMPEVKQEKKAAEQEIKITEIKIKEAAPETVPKKKTATAKMTATKTTPAKTTAAKTAPVQPEKPVQGNGSVQEAEEVASKFDWSFPSTRKPEAEGVAVQKSRSRLAAKVSAADKAEEAGKSALGETAASVSHYAEEEEEEDEILKALDKYFVYEGEKTVQERSTKNGRGHKR